MNDQAEERFQSGIALYEMGQLDAAIDEWRIAITLDPTSAVAHYNLGHALADQGLLEESIVENNQAIRLNPEYASAYLGLGRAFYMKSLTLKKRKEQMELCLLPARNAYLKSLSLTSSNFYTLYGLGLVEDLLRNNAAAIKFLNAAIEVNPRDERPYDILFRVQRRSWKWRDAWRTLLRLTILRCEKER